MAGRAYYNEIDRLTSAPARQAGSACDQGGDGRSGTAPRPARATEGWRLSFGRPIARDPAGAQSRSLWPLRKPHTPSAHRGSGHRNACSCCRAGASLSSSGDRFAPSQVSAREMCGPTLHCSPFGRRPSRATCCSAQDQWRTTFRTFGTCVLPPPSRRRAASANAPCSDRNRTSGGDASQRGPHRTTGSGVPERSRSGSTSSRRA